MNSKKGGSSWISRGKLYSEDGKALNKLCRDASIRYGDWWPCMRHGDWSFMILEVPSNPTILCDSVCV